jgi:hypothetical protein
VGPYIHCCAAIAVDFSPYLCGDIIPLKAQQRLLADFAELTILMTGHKEIPPDYSGGIRSVSANKKKKSVLFRTLFFAW